MTDSSSTPRLWTLLRISIPPACEEPTVALLQRLRPRDGLETAIVDNQLEIRLWLPESEAGPDFQDELNRELKALQQWFPDFQHDLTTETIPEENWAEAWKKDFKPLRIGRRFVICPSWLEADTGPDDILIRLDPGGAFGTGLHETTHLCLVELEKMSPGSGSRLLDIGTGSGILCIAAAHLGMETIGTDIDPYAIEVARENAEINNTDLRVFTGDLVRELPDSLLGAGFDLIIANILLPEVLRLIPALSRFLCNKGRIMLSGIITEQADEVRETMEKSGFRVLGQQELHGWAVVIGEKNVQ